MPTPVFVSLFSLVKPLQSFTDIGEREIAKVGSIESGNARPRCEEVPQLRFSGTGSLAREERLTGKSKGNGR